MSEILLHREVPNRPYKTQLFCATRAPHFSTLNAGKYKKMCLSVLIIISSYLEYTFRIAFSFKRCELRRQSHC